MSKRDQQDLTTATLAVVWVLVATLAGAFWMGLLQ